MTVKIRTSGEIVGASDLSEVVRKMAQQNALTLTGAITALTNSSGGTAGTITQHTTFANVADDSTSLADGTESDAALDTIHNAIREIYTKANATAAVLGIDEITYNGGGAATNGTVEAVTASVAAAGTGAQATETEVVADAFDNAIYNAAILINTLADATGIARVALGYTGTIQSTIAAITVDVGTPADPGISKAAMDANLVIYRNNIKTLAEKLILINTVTDPYVLAEGPIL